MIVSELTNKVIDWAFNEGIDETADWIVRLPSEVVHANFVGLVDLKLLELANYWGMHLLKINYRKIGLYVKIES